MHAEGLFCAQVPLIFGWCRDASFEIMNQNLDVSLQPKCRTDLAFAFLYRFIRAIAKCTIMQLKGKVVSAQVHFRRLSWRQTKMQSRSCSVSQDGLMFECPCKNHCLQTCWQFLEVEVEGHTHNGTTSFGPQESSFLLTGVGVTQREVRPLVLARHQAGEQACSAPIVVNRDGSNGVSLDRHVVNNVFTSKQKHWLHASR